MLRRKRSPTAVLLCGLLLLQGCAHHSIRTLQRHPQQERLEQLLAMVIPYTAHPKEHYWLRIYQPVNQSVDFLIWPQRHVYFSERLVSIADERIVAALIAHGVAHHELHHLRKRSVVSSISYVAFLVGGMFVPGLGLGWFLANSMTTHAMSVEQEISADTTALRYLQFVERTGGAWGTPKAFGHRIAALKKLQAGS